MHFSHLLSSRNTIRISRSGLTAGIPVSCHYVHLNIGFFFFSECLKIMIRVFGKCVITGFSLFTIFTDISFTSGTILTNAKGIEPNVKNLNTITESCIVVKYALSCML